MIDPFPTLARAVVIILLTLMAGGFAFNTLVLRDKATATLRAAAHKRRHDWLLLLVGLTAIASVFDHAARAQLATPQTLLQLLVRLAPFGVLGWLLITQRGDSALALAVGALALLNQSLNSHAAVEREPLLPLAADWLHVTCVAAWLGGVGYYVAVLMPTVAQDRALIKELGASIERFSPLAMMCVLVIAITGIIQSTSFVVNLDALIGTAYGRTLLIKIMMFLVLIGFGAFHQFVIGPNLNAWRAKAESADEAARRFRVSIGIEIIVALVPLIAAAAMTVLPLARDAI